MTSLTQQSNSPGLNTGQLDAETISNGTSINLFQGNISMPLELISLPGLNNHNCDLTLLYQSQVDTKVGVWNMDDIPTSFGLGWDLSFPKIVKDEKLNGEPSDDIYFLIDQGNPTRLIASPYSTSSEDQIEYELENYNFHKITYFPKLYKWEILKEDGTVFIYGEESSALQWGIRWGNWIGPSLMAEGQERYVKAWNLSKVENIYGNFYSLKYQSKEQCVGNGTLTYTKECQVQTIQNDLQWSLIFEYQPMVYDITSEESPKEYLDPYQTPQLVPNTDVSDAYQSCYTSMYVNQIRLTNQNNQEISRVQFQYYELKNLTSFPDSGNATQKLIYGATYKRYLKSVHKIAPNGETKPGTCFFYNFETDPLQPRGALIKIIYPGGGQSIFTYDRITVGADDTVNPGSRSIEILNPFGETQLGKPRIWYGQDYTISAWYDENQSQLKLNVFTWLGHWTISQPDWWTFEESLDLDKLQLAICENCFCLALPVNSSYQTKVYFFYRNHLKPSEWVKCSLDSLSSYDTFALQIQTGNNFFVLYDDDNKCMNRVFFHPFEREFRVEDILGDSNFTETYFISAYSNYYLIYRYDTDTPTNSSFTIWYFDEYYNWQQGSTLNDFISVPSFQQSRYCQFGSSDSFIALASITAQRTDTFDTSLKILMWDTQFTNLRFADLETPWVEEGVRSPFSYLPLSIQPYLGPQSVENNLVTSGPNCYLFDGHTWSFQKVDVYDDGSNVEDQFYWYAFQRSGLLKTENLRSRIYTSLTYGSTEGLKEYVLENIEQVPSQSIRVRKNYPTYVGKYLSYDTQVYFNPFDQDWDSIQNYWIGELTVESFLSIDTTTIINQAPYFMAFMTLDEQGAPFDTRIVFFRNGDFIRNQDGTIDFEILPSQQLSRLLNKNYQYQTSLNGKLPAISQGFASYSIEENLSECKSLTLHHYANESLQDPIQTFVVTKMSTDSGDNKVDKCYEYDHVSSAQDSTQTIIRFQKVTEYQGCSIPENQLNGYTISYFANGLSDLTDLSSNLPSALDGILVKKEHYNAQGNLVSSTEINSEVCTEIPGSWVDTVLVPLFGAFVQTKSKTTMLDGVYTDVHFEYLRNTGQVCQTETSYANGEGERICEQKLFTYACEKYPSMRETHQLTSIAQNVIQTKKESEPHYQVRYNKIHLYQEWASTRKAYWQVFQEYVATHENAIIDWQTLVLEEQDWLCTQKIGNRDLQGNVINCVDVDTSPVYVIYDDLGRFPLASFTNTTSADGAFYDSLESYQTCNLYFDEMRVSPITGDAFTGMCCAEMAHSGYLTRNISIQKSSWTQKYSLSAYLKTNDLNAILTFKMIPFNSSTIIQKNVTLQSGWFHFHWIMDLSQLSLQQEELTIQLQIQFSGDNFYTRLDHLFFRPVESIFSAQIYDSESFRPTDNLTNQGLCERIFYNQFQDQQALIGIYGNVIGFRTGFLTQQLEISPFSEDNPNQELSIRGQKMGFYDQFKDDALQNYEFIDSQESDWCVKNGQLQLVNSSSQLLGARVKRQNYHSNEVALCVYAPDPSAKCICVGIGSLFVRWNGEWSLGEWQNNNFEILYQNVDLPFGREWIFVILQNRVLFLSNGVKIFDQRLSQDVLSGAVQLGMQQPGHFQQLVVAEDLQLDLNFTDGFGQVIQSLRWESTQKCVVEHFVYDNCGRLALQLKPASVAMSSLEYLPEWINASNSSIWDGQGIQGDINNYYPEDEGYPFQRDGYEASPLDRICQKGQPGKLFAITGENTHIETITYTNNSIINHFNLPENSYFVHILTDADGRKTYEYLDIAQHKIGVVQEGVENNRIASWCYDANGNLVQASPPNFYAKQLNASALITYEYNFQGYQIESHHPDMGQSLIIYDNAGIVRVYQDSQARDEGLINYMKYDSLGRIVEKGYLSYDWDEISLQNLIQNPEWPENGHWLIRYFYDGDDLTPNMLGNLWKIQTANGNSESPLLEIFEYDALNCLTSTQMTFESGLTATIHSSYNCCGILQNISDSETHLSSTRSYNALGQLQEVTNWTSDRTVSTIKYSYNAFGSIFNIELYTPNSQTPVLERNLQYNSPQWLREMEDSTFQQILNYEQNVLEEFQYYNGNIGGQQIQFSDGTSNSYSYQIDEWNRLIQSQNGDSHEIWQIDGNNNFESWTTNANTRIFTTTTPGNQLVTIEGEGIQANYSYTKSGEITSVQQSDQNVQFSYYEGQGPLHKLTKSEMEWVEYGYNGNNLRTLKSIYSQSQLMAKYHYIYHNSEKPQLLIETESGNTLRFEELPYLNLIFQNDTDWYACKDHLGSTRTIVDSVGTICGEFHYSTYGIPTIIQTPPMHYPFLFTGYEYDWESNLYNAGVRLYDAKIGRFLMTDPKAEFFSPYVYVGNNPLIASDPTGRMSTKAIGWIALIVGIVASVATAGLASAFVAPAAATMLGIQSATLAAGLSTGIEIVLGSVAGAFASQAVSAGATHQAFFTKSLGTSLLANVAGGMVGAGIGAGMGAAMKGLSSSSSKAISGASSGVSKTTKNVGKTVIKEMSANVADSTTNSAVNGAFGDDWNAMDGAQVALCVLTGALPAGVKKYKSETSGNPVELKSMRLLDEDGNVVQEFSAPTSKSSKNGKTISSKEASKMGSVHATSTVMKSNTMGKRTQTYSNKRMSNSGSVPKQFAKTHTFVKELHMDVLPSIERLI